MPDWNFKLITQVFVVSGYQEGIEEEPEAGDAEEGDATKGGKGEIHAAGPHRGGCAQRQIVGHLPHIGAEFERAWVGRVVPQLRLHPRVRGHQGEQQRGRREKLIRGEIEFLTQLLYSSLRIAV